MDRLSSPLGSSIYVTVLCRYVRSLSCWSSSLSASSPLRPLLFSPINIPTRQMRSREVKQFYSSEGDYNPPVNDVISRFKRLRWGAFIHARSGRRRHLYRPNTKQHVPANLPFIYPTESTQPMIEPHRGRTRKTF
ncbi:unnamed protein product [Dicrocoelium dendriticum]|nr:unnamed protein product [Dicrocoelium dendriticum]